MRPNLSSTLKEDGFTEKTSPDPEIPTRPETDPGQLSISPTRKRPTSLNTWSTTRARFGIMTNSLTTRPFKKAEKSSSKISSANLPKKPTKSRSTSKEAGSTKRSKMRREDLIRPAEARPNLLKKTRPSEARPNLLKWGLAENSGHSKLCLVIIIGDRDSEIIDLTS